MNPLEPFVTLVSANPRTRMAKPPVPAKVTGGEIAGWAAFAGLGAATLMGALIGLYDAGISRGKLERYMADREKQKGRGL